MRLTRAAATLCLIFALMLGASGCAKEILPSRGSVTVLTLIDFQRDYLSHNGRMRVAQDQIDPMIKATNALIVAMRQQAMPVVYTLNEYSPFEVVGDFARNFSAMRYEPGATLDPRINDVAGVYFGKDEASAFANDQFDEHLELIGTGRLVIAGVYADHSVMATAEDALKRGYTVTVISDAVAARDDQHRDDALQKLKAAGAEVETSDQFIASLGAENKG